MQSSPEAFGFDLFRQTPLTREGTNSRSHPKTRLHWNAQSPAIASEPMFWQGNFPNLLNGFEKHAGLVWPWPSQSH